jgi:hypothetical protein
VDVGVEVVAIAAPGDPGIAVAVEVRERLGEADQARRVAPVEHRVAPPAGGERVDELRDDQRDRDDHRAADRQPREATAAQHAPDRRDDGERTGGRERKREVVKLGVERRRHPEVGADAARERDEPARDERARAEPRREPVGHAAEGKGGQDHQRREGEREQRPDRPHHQHAPDLAPRDRQ